jgi:hypothetical protein
MDRDSIVARYRHLREILDRHKAAALTHLSQQAVLDQARFLHIAAGKTILSYSDEEHTLVFDLALHAPGRGRSRAFERYRNAARLPADCDDARVVDALCAARFVIGVVKGPHDVAGLLVTDVLRAARLQLIDLNLEASWGEPFVFAGHLIAIEGFWMTAGTLTPIEKSDVDDALDRLPPRRGGTVEALADDPVFAGLVCRAALARGALDDIMIVEAGSAAA